MSDAFRRKPLDLKKPITADMVLIEWDGLLAQATNISLQYQQPVTRRWTLGTNGKSTCVIYPGRPSGSLQIARLVADQNENIFSKAGFNICEGTATIHIQLDGASALENCEVKGGTYVLRGCIVDSYGLTGDADSLTITDNVNISFMQMDYEP